MDSKLIPFLITAPISTYLTANLKSTGNASLVSIAIKVFPIAYLAFYVSSSVASIRFSKGDEKLKERREKLSSRVVCGLLFSAIGDCFMINHHKFEFFALGATAFAGAQICYIAAFGIHPKRWSSALVIYGMLILLEMVIVPFSSWGTGIIFLVYGSILMTMVWRATDRFLVADGRTPRQNKLLVCGAFLFLLSDFCIALFKVLLTEYALLGYYLVLATYYSSQGLISYSVA